MSFLRNTAFSIFALATLGPLEAAGVKAMFDPAKPEVGPFPTDFLTAPATNTRTSRRVRLPDPGNCTVQPNVCQDVFLVNQLDGFNLHARVRVRFSGAINPDTVKEGVFLVAGDNLTKDEAGVHKNGDVMRLNQIVYDPSTNTAYGKPDGAMDQHRRYLLVVTDAVKDPAGDPVEADDAFNACSGAGASDDYCKDLAQVLKLAPAGAKIAGASVFTTMSATAWMEKARDALSAVPPTATPQTGRALFRLGEIGSLALRLQTGLLPAGFEDTELPIELIQGISGFWFGSFSSPNYLDSGRSIAAVDSGADLPAPQSMEEVRFHVALPSSPKPAKGYPVVIFGHGLGDSRFGGPSLVLNTFAEAGMALVAISAVGHGNGPQGTINITDRNGSRFQLPAGGRGADINGDGRIDPGEGCIAIPSAPTGLRDCLRQTAVDLLQLARVLRAGLDLDGDGTPDLDPENVYYAGQSLGGLYGTLFMALDPGVKTAAINAAGASTIDIARWSPNFRPLTIQNLLLRRPSLLNSPAGFDESYPLRDQPARVVTTPGAIEIQNTLEMLEWLQAEGDPSSFAAHLRTSPLPGVPLKHVLFQYGLGDRTIPNNTQTALVRLANMKGSTWIYRHDVARRATPDLPANSHTFLTYFAGTSSISLFAVPVGNTAQRQIARFFQTGIIENTSAAFSFFYGGDILDQPETLTEELNLQ